MSDLGSVGRRPMFVLVFGLNLGGAVVGIVLLSSLMLIVQASDATLGEGQGRTPDRWKVGMISSASSWSDTSASSEVISPHCTAGTK